MWLFSPLDFAHTHTHTLSLSLSLMHNYTYIRNMQTNNNEGVDILSDYHVQWLPENTNQLSAPQLYACVDEYSNCSVDWMPYYILNRYNGAYHCVCVYALSDDSCHCKPYYTHHSYMGSLNYLCNDVLLDDAFDWMPYYKLHMNMDAHHYVCVYA